MMARGARYDLVIIGMGSGGILAAELAAALNLRVAVVERGRVGGDCLWTGCVPSKALLASAKAAHAIRHADRYGLRAAEPEIDLAAIWQRIRRVQQSIAATDDDPERYRQMGVEIISGHATVGGPHEVIVDGHRRLATRFILVCTGSRPAEPVIPGLAAAGFLTSETLFELDEPPRSMIIIGGGPIAVELAQAFERLGVTTAILQRGERLLSRDEPELVTALTACLRAEGVDVRLGIEPVAVRLDGETRVVSASTGAVTDEFRAAGVFVATGRHANVDGLGLEALGIEVAPVGVTVDERGRTAVPSIYAAGDVAGRHLFTHAAAHEATRAVRDMFLPGTGPVDPLVPWCTFTDPELAHAGLTSSEAMVRYGSGVQVTRAPLVANDRARADGATEGSIVLVGHKQRLVGAHILAPAAGEMIHELALAIRHQISLADVAKLVHVYPTYSTSIARLIAQPGFDRARRYRGLTRLARKG